MCMYYLINFLVLKGCAENIAACRCVPLECLTGNCMRFYQTLVVVPPIIRAGNSIFASYL